LSIQNVVDLAQNGRMGPYPIDQGYWQSHRALTQQIQEQWECIRLQIDQLPLVATGEPDPYAEQRDKLCRREVQLQEEQSILSEEEILHDPRVTQEGGANSQPRGVELDLDWNAIRA